VVQALKWLVMSANTAQLAIDKVYLFSTHVEFNAYLN
jgi:hypothetical protein